MARRGFSGAVIRAMGASDHTAVVTGSRYLAPHFLRVSFRSETLFDEIEAPPTAWLRFWFPDPDGRPVEHQRGYTISEADEGAGTFSIDVVLHEPAGPASAWARAAEPGDEIALTSLGSSPFEVPEEPPAGYLLIGDSASLPAISAILRTVPDDVPLEVYLEEHTPQDRDIPLPEHPRARVHWVTRRDATSLAAALEARDWSDWYAWVAPETGSLKHLRVRIRDEFGFPKSEQHVQAYWSEGRAMGKRRDHGDAADAARRAEPAGAAPEHGEASTAAPTAPAAEAPAPAAGTAAGARGSWRAQAAGRLLRPLRATLVVGGIVQGIVTLIQLAPYVLLAELARLLVTGADTGRLWALGIWAIVLLGVGTLLGAALLTWLHVVDGRFERDVRRRLLGKLARLPLGWFDARTSGQVKQLIQDDTLALHYLVTHAVPDAVAAVIAPVAVLAYLFAVDWRIALILFVPVLVYIVTMTIMVTRSGPKVSQSLRWAERMNSEAGGYLDGQPVVRVFGGAAASSFRARLGEYVRFLDEWQRPFSSQKAIMDLATRPSTSLLLIVLLGTLLVVGGAMNPIDLLPSLLLGTTFGSRLMGIGYGLSGVRTGLLAARRVQVTLDERELDVPEESAPTRADTPPGRVELDHVGFAYRPGVPVLDDIDLTLEPGTVTALVGPSGSGKSTLAALVARFHDVTSGAIRIGGADVRDLTPEELYARVGFVFQQTQLVHGSVHENIALAAPDATRERVEEAARAAQLHERILRLPDGYDTLIGADAALSGGEQQRIAIARAILADTPVLVLDEATAFADPESEYLVQRALDRLAAGRTVLVIAHRLHTVVGADRIVVLDHGRVAESGTHEELLARDGRYRRLWEAGGATTPHEETEVAR